MNGDDFEYVANFTKGIKKKMIANEISFLIKSKENLMLL